MPIRGKRFMRRIVRIEISPELTQRGNPKHYVFTLDCGHTRREFHGPYAVVRVAAFDILVKDGKEPSIKMHCYECADGKTASPKCEKTQRPLGVMPIGYCHKNCTEEKVAECTKSLLEWDRKDKPYLYEKEG